MRCVAICCAAILLSCAKADNQPPRGPSGTLSLASLAGTWRVRGFNEAGDSIIGFQLVATGETSGWTITFAGRPPIPLRVVAVAGDSVITEGGPYESVLRRGVQVRTRGVFRLEGDTLVGTTVAHYTTSGPDSLLRVRNKATRIP
jgi:hypothetical protein